MESCSLRQMDQDNNSAPMELGKVSVGRFVGFFRNKQEVPGYDQEIIDLEVEVMESTKRPTLHGEPQKQTMDTTESSQQVSNNSIVDASRVSRPGK